MATPTMQPSEVNLAPCGARAFSGSYEDVDALPEAQQGAARERNQKKFYELALRRGMGPFVPFRRKCGNCAALGWSSWPSSPVSHWRCCGCDAASETKAKCEERMGNPGVKPKPKRGGRAARSHG